MRGWAGLALSVLLAALAQASAFPAAAASPFAGWAAVVVAGDFHAHSGGPTEAFDNARRDVATELQRLGFAPENVRTFSVRPQLYPDKPGPSEIAPIYDGLAEVASRATAGCLVYFTSHGAPTGVVLGDVILPPRVMNRMVDSACPGRPTVVVVSACFSGVFIPAMRSNQRMILTAARRDRTSFGCGESDRYPFFDDCFLSSSPKARDFAGLGALVQACVARKEAEVGASPPSEPQLWIGAGLRPILPLYVFPPG